jgi:hypothetical protein
MKESNIIFNPTELEIYTDIKYKKYKNTYKGRFVQVRRKKENGKWGEYEYLPISSNGINKIWNVQGNTMPIDVPAHLLVYKGIVVGIELVREDDPLSLNTNMKSNIKLLFNFVNSDQMKDKIIYSDLNGIFWESNDALVETFLTKDRTLRGVPMSTLFYNEMHKSVQSALTPRSRYAIRYVYENIEAISTPIFSSRIGKGKVNSEDYVLDLISKKYRVNLNFMIKTSIKLEKFVDYEELDRMFGIYETVVRLGVESLPKLPKATKEKYPIKLSVKDCVIWLLGLQTRYSHQSIENLEVIRSAIKFLLTKCLTKEGHNDSKNLYNEGFNEDNIPLITDIEFDK